jgi:hypothetical protein
MHGSLLFDQSITNTRTRSAYRLVRESIVFANRNISAFGRYHDIAIPIAPLASRHQICLYQTSEQHLQYLEHLMFPYRSRMSAIEDAEEIYKRRSPHPLLLLH